MQGIRLQSHVQFTRKSAYYSLVVHQGQRDEGLVQIQHSGNEYSKYKYAKFTEA